MTEPIIMQFELTRKQMISANDRLHYQQKGKITRFLRELAQSELVANYQGSIGRSDRCRNLDR